MVRTLHILNTKTLTKTLEFKDIFNPKLETFNPILSLLHFALKIRFIRLIKSILMICEPL